MPWLSWATFTRKDLAFPAIHKLSKFRDLIEHMNTIGRQQWYSVQDTLLLVAGCAIAIVNIHVGHFLEDPDESEWASSHLKLEFEDKYINPLLKYMKEFQEAPPAE